VRRLFSSFQNGLQGWSLLLLRLTLVGGLFGDTASHNPATQIVSVQNLVGDGKHYVSSSSVNLPAGMRSLEINYSAAAFTKPECAQYRYHLLGMDKAWQKAGSRTQAYSTNPTPGHCQLEVSAANEDGIWSTKSAVAGLYAARTFYARPLFKTPAVLLVLAATALAVFSRLRARRRYRKNMEARHAERERIARDLHDTLLQGVQALLFRLQMWETEKTIPQPLRAEIAAVADQTRSIVLEGRERILSIRKADSKPVNLAESLTLLGAEAPNRSRPSYEVRVEGELKAMQVDVLEQLRDIAREAIRNAYRHARAAHIVVTIEYLRRAVILKVEDDGVGFKPSFADCGVKGNHFGIVGMRERAAALGAKLMIDSESRRGTTITVIVPGAIAYRDGYRWSWRPRPLRQTGPGSEH
jgi:signal transduction histidine kinase